jgi:uncharacterized protein involved in outer membrane biogenesis
VKKHPLISILVAVVVLLLLAVLLVPLFVNANTFRSTLETQLSDALGRKVTLGNLSFSVFSGGLVADNISIADDPAFSSKPFLQAKSLHIGGGRAAALPPPATGYQLCSRLAVDQPRSQRAGNVELL